MTDAWRIRITRLHVRHWGARLIAPGGILLHRLTRDSQPAALAAALAVSRELEKAHAGGKQKEEKGND